MVEVWNNVETIRKTRHLRRRMDLAVLLRNSFQMSSSIGDISYLRSDTAKNSIECFHSRDRIYANLLEQKKAFT